MALMPDLVKPLDFCVRGPRLLISVIDASQSGRTFRRRRIISQPARRLNNKTGCLSGRKAPSRKAAVFPAIGFSASASQTRRAHRSRYSSSILSRAYVRIPCHLIDARKNIVPNPAVADTFFWLGNRQNEEGNIVKGYVSLSLEAGLH